jgi:hypothetical protein
MPTYYLNEASLELDGSWKDETIQLLSTVDARGDRTALVIVRDKPTDGEALDSYVDRMLKGQSQELRSYELLGRRAGSVDGTPSLEVKFRWLAAEELIFQQQAYVPHQTYFLTFTLSSVFRHAAQAEARFNEILSTVRFRGR